MERLQQTGGGSLKPKASEETVGRGRFEGNLYPVHGDGEALVSRIDRESFIQKDGETCGKGWILRETESVRVFDNQRGVCGWREQRPLAKGNEEKG
jgi:hypothetical protein